MALIFSPVYTVSFDTIAGSDIQYELDILRSYEEGTTPSWFVDGAPPATKPLIGGPEPITIEWQKDYNVYKPILGSSAKINLMVTNQQTYDDFNAGSRYEYQSRLRRRVNVLGSGTRVAGTTFTQITGTDVAVFNANGYMNVMISNDRDGTVPLLDSTNAGRNVYASTNGGANVVFVGTIRTDTDLNGNLLRVRMDRNGNTQADADELNSLVNPGAEVWLADAGDSGNATTFESGMVFDDVWCGFITPIDGTERVTTFPFGVSFSATDGIGLLEDAVVPEIDDTVSGIFDDANDVSLIDVILYSLRQTGLDLPVYINSGISTASGDALINALANPYSFYTNLERTERQTLKDAFEGILSAFNSKLVQSNGRWYIYNASTHGGFTNESTWKTYTVVNSAYVAGDDVTETLGKSINSLDTTDLIPSNQDLVLNTRRPVGSIECSPKDFVARNIVSNGGFELEEEGWQKGATSYDDLDFSTTIRLEGRRSITSNRNRRTLTEASDVWFESSTGYSVDSDAGLEINIDWLGSILVDSGNTGVRNVRLAYQVMFVPDTPFQGSELFLPVLGFGNIPSYNTFQTQALYWDFVNTEWIPSSNTFLPGSKSETFFREPHVTDVTKEVVAGPADVDTWLNEKINIDAPRDYYDAQDSAFYEIPDGKVYLRFFYPRGNRQQGSGKAQYRQHGIGSLRAYVDNIQISSDFESQIESPTFERIQEDYTSTMTYEPTFASESHELIIQTLAEKEYWRTGNTLDETLPKSLEEIGTQLKLNDFHEQFKYYEGSLINNTTTPLSPINKVSIAFNNYVETASCIFNGGMFKPKQNVFEVAMYVPNQVLDIAPTNRMDVTNDDYDPNTGELLPGYYTENINLVATPFPGRSEKVSYVLAFDITAIDLDDGNAVVANGLVPKEEYISLVGLPGDTITYDLILTPASGYIGSTSSIVVTNTDADPRPEYAIFDAGLTSIQGTLTLPITITFPEKSEYEILKATIGLTEFNAELLPDAVTYTVTTTNPDTTNLTLNKTVFTFTGLPGETLTQTLNIEPTDPRRHQLYSENFSTDPVGDTNFTVDDPVGGGRLVSATITATLPTDTGLTHSFNLIGAVSSIESDDDPHFNHVVTFNTPANSSPFEISNTFRGGEGDVIPYRFTAIPDADFFFQSATGAFLSKSSGITDNGVVLDGQNLESTINVTIGATDITTGVVTLGGASTTEEPYSLQFVMNNIGLEGATITPGNVVRRFDESDFGDSIATFDITIMSGTGMEFTDSSQVAVDVNEAGVPIPGGTGTLPESQFVVTDRPVVNGNAVKRISGTFPSAGGDYVIPVNIAGTALLGVATTGSFATDSVTIPLAGGLPKATFTANGRVSVVSSASPTTNTNLPWLNNGVVTYQNNANGSVGHSGAVLSTASPRTGYWLLYPEGVSSGAPLDSISIIQSDSQTGLETTLWRLSPSGFGGFATYTDGLGIEKVVSVPLGGTPVDFCSSNTPTLIGGILTENPSGSTVSCAFGEVGPGLQYAEEASSVAKRDSSGALSGDGFTFRTSLTVPTLDDDTVITLVPRS